MAGTKLYSNDSKDRSVIRSSLFEAISPPDTIVNNETNRHLDDTLDILAREQSGTKDFVSVNLFYCGQQTSGLLLLFALLSFVNCQFVSLSLQRPSQINTNDGQQILKYCSSHIIII